MTTTKKLPLVGIITPNAKGEVQPEAAEIFAGRVDVVTYGVGVEQLAIAGYEAALAKFPAAIEQLASRGIDALVVNGTSLSFAFGRKYHDDMVARLRRETGLPVTTMAESMVDALKAVGARRVVLATAYDEGVTRLLGDFLETHDIRSEIGAYLGIVENAKLRLLKPQDIVALAVRAAERRAFDAMVISCGNLRTIPLTVELEQRFGVPVVSSSLVGVWGALRLAGAGAAIPGKGRLFEVGA